MIIDYKEFPNRRDEWRRPEWLHGISKKTHSGGFTMTLRRFILAFTLAAFATAAAAQEYPNKPIKMIVPFPPAGGTDILGRTVANKLAELDKWNVVVDNKPGAGGNIGVDAAAKSPADGYTLVMGQTSNLAISP